MAVEIPQNIPVLLLGAFIVLIAFLTDRTRCPEYLRKFPKISVIHLFSKRDRKATLSLAQKEGIYIEYVGKWIVHVSKAEYAQAILANPLKFPKILPTLERPSSLVAKFLGTNTRISNMHKWLKYRDGTANMFSHFDQADITSRLINSHISNWTESGMSEVDILPCMQEVTQEMLCYLIFNQEPDSVTRDLMKYFTDIEQELESRRYLLLPFLEYIPFVGRPGIHQKIEEMNSILYGMIERSAESLKSCKDSRSPDLISSLLNNKDQPFTQLEVRDLIVGSIWAGYESMPSVLATAVYYVATNPAIQKQARSEVAQLLLNHESLTQGKLAYVSAIIKETMRLNPTPTTFDTRITKEAVQFGNYVLPQNTPITIDTKSLHLDPEIWKDPFDFKPQRFLDSPETDLNEWLGFGGGLRKCVAAEFSIQQMTVILAVLLSRFVITLPELGLARDMSPNNIKVKLEVNEKS